MKWPDHDGFTFGIFFCIFVLIISIGVTINVISENNMYSKMSAEQILALKKKSCMCGEK
jgi:hypothetical protein